MKKLDRKQSFLIFALLLFSFFCEAQFNAPEDTFAFAKITLLNVDHSGYTGNIQLIGTKPGRKYTATLKKGYAKVKLPFNDVYTIRWKGIDNYKTLRIGDFPYVTHTYKSYTYRFATINFYYQNPQGKPLPNEVVHAKGINNDSVYVATTDKNGKASFLVPFEDAYSMSVKYRPDFQIVRARELGQPYTLLSVKLIWKGSREVELRKALADSLKKAYEIQHEEYLKELEAERIRDSIHRAIDILSEDKEKYFEKVLKLKQSTLVDMRKVAPPFTKEEAAADYKKNLLGKEIDETVLGWTGSRENCKAGDISEKAKENFLVNINYFRRMTGVWDGVYWNDEKNKNCQKCALMCSVNGTINHHPPSSWSCYNQDGASACGYSNLSLGGMGGLGHVSMYMDDFGDNNYSVGHRRWLINPGANEMGIGATNDRTAIAVFPAYSQPQHKEVRDGFVAWPPRGYVPYRIIYPRWSFGIEDGIFKDAKVEMLDKNGRKMKLKTLKQSQGCGVPTIVWEPKFERMEEGERYEVIISNVKVQGERFVYRYWVEAI